MKRRFFLSWASCVMIAAAAVAGCGGTGSGNTAGGGGTGNTAASGGGGSAGGIIPGECNPTCQAPQVCSAAGMCIDPGTCASDGDCVEVGTVCDTATGKCVPGGACGSQEAKVDPVPPNMLLVLDRSCSMKNAVGNSTKWDIAVAAINKMTTDYNGQIRFGLTLFPDKVTPDCGQDKIPIPVAPGNEMAIQTMLTNALQNADPLFPDGPCVTNITRGMQQAATEPAFLDTERASYAVLISDGKETCHSDAVTEETIKMMFDVAKVPTFVIGFGSGVDPAQMDKFAVAGGVPSSGATTWYDAGDQASLDMALATIAKATLSCTYSLDSVPPNPNEIFVFFDNVTKVPRDLMNGWEYDISKNQIVFYGPACDSLKNGIVKDLDIVFGCDAPTPN